MESVIDEMFQRLPLHKPDVAKMYRERFELVTFGRKVLKYDLDQYISVLLIVLN